MRRFEKTIKEMRFLAVTLMVLASALTACGDIHLADYKPENAHERAIVALLVQYQDARNNRDLDRFLSLLHDDGVFEFQCGRMVSKAVLENELAAFWADIQAGNAAVFPLVHECINGDYFPTCTFANPHVDIDGDTAAGSVLFTKGVCRVPLNFRMSRDAGGWLITHTEWGDG